MLWLENASTLHAVITEKKKKKKKILLNKESKEYKHGDPCAENPTKD